MSSLDSLKIVLNENDRLKDEMRTLIEAAVKDRQTIEFNQRDNIKKMPEILSAQYKTLIEEYNTKMSKESKHLHL